MNGVRLSLGRSVWPLAVMMLVLAAMLLPATAAARGAPAAAAGTPPLQVRTVGDLIDRVDAAWQTVRTFRAVETIEVSEQPATPAPTTGTPASAIQSRVVIQEEVIIPDRRHLTYTSDGVDVGEVIVIGNEIFARGAQAKQLGATDSHTWIKVDINQTGANTPQRQAIEILRAPITASPLAALPPASRGLLLEPAGTAITGGRACDLYHLNPPPALKNAWPQTIGIDRAGLPCQFTVAVNLDTRVITTSFSYLAFNEPLSIEPPALGT